MKRLLAVLVLFGALAQPAVASASLAPISHVIVVMEENHSQSAVLGQMPYLTTLGDTYAHTTSYNAITHPSLPNYFAITSGSTQGATGDCGSGVAGCSTSAENIFHQVDQAGGTWAGWAESMPGNCATQNAPPYVVHHAVAPYYTDVADCQSQDVPLDAANVPSIRPNNYILVTPNLNHDAHDGSLGAADAWLQQVVGTLLQRPHYLDGSTLIEITFDEGSGGDNTVYTVLINPRFTHIALDGSYTHYSSLRLAEEVLGLPLLGNAATAPDMAPALGL